MIAPTARILLTLAALGSLLTACAQRKQPAEARPARSGSPDDPSTVTAEEIARAPAPGESIEKILQGRVAGVHVEGTPDGGIAVRIRGGSSINGSNEPLYVVNGVPITPGPNGSLTGINPYDIASITVLKDAASMTMYGARGANGVIVIKTKGPAGRKVVQP